MQISYTNDEQRGAGYGILHCTDVPFTVSGCCISMQRASDRCFLANNGEWMAQQVFLPVATSASGPGTLQLSIGPGIVDQLDTQERYRIHLASDDGKTATAQLQLSNIIYSVGETLTNTATVPQPSAPTDTQASPPPPTPPVPVEETPPLDTATPQENIPPDKDAEALPPPPPEASPTGKGKGLLLAVLLLLALGLVGGGVWYYLHRTSTPAPVPSSGTDTPEPPQPEALPQKAPQTPDTASPATAPTAPPKRTVEEQVQLFFGGKEITPEAAARLSRELPTGTGAEQDAVYRLFYFAGEHGEASVLMDYAACLDPSRPQWGSINKDAVAAWEIYEKAKASHPEAGDAQKALRTWLNQKAAAGDAQAKYWLQQLP